MDVVGVPLSLPLDESTTLASMRLRPFEPRPRLAAAAPRASLHLGASPGRTGHPATDRVTGEPAGGKGVELLLLYI